MVRRQETIGNLLTGRYTTIRLLRRHSGSDACVWKLNPMEYRLGIVPFQNVHCHRLWLIRLSKSNFNWEKGPAAEIHNMLDDC